MGVITDILDYLNRNKVVAILFILISAYFFMGKFPGLQQILFLTVGDADIVYNGLLTKSNNEFIWEGDPYLKLTDSYSNYYVGFLLPENCEEYGEYCKDLDFSNYKCDLTMDKYFYAKTPVIPAQLFEIPVTFKERDVKKIGLDVLACKVKKSEIYEKCKKVCFDTGVADPYCTNDVCKRDLCSEICGMFQVRHGIVRFYPVGEIAKTCEDFGYFSEPPECPTGYEPQTIEVNGLTCYTGHCIAIEQPEQPTPPEQPTEEQPEGETFDIGWIILLIGVGGIAYYFIRKRGLVWMRRR